VYFEVLGEGMVVILMGVSGSGKTAVGQALAARLGWAFEDADNWHPASNVAKMRSGRPLNDEDRAPWLQSLNRIIRSRIAERRGTVLACSALKAKYRETLRNGVHGTGTLRFVYLRGTYKQIDQRLRERSGHFMPESLLRSQFEALEEPTADEAFVVDTALSIEAAVEAIIVGLKLDSSSSGASTRSI
jgi:gluconokinase